MRPQVRTIDREIARLASLSHGVLTRKQLLAAGLTPAQIAVRLRRGQLFPEHRGVYRVGHRAASIEATYLCAVLACGPAALLCGRAAAHMWGLVRSAPPVAEVVAPTERRVPGVRTHRVRGGTAAVASICRGIPVTSVPQTLVDLASVLDVEALARACHEAVVRYRTTPRHVEELLDRVPNRRGAGRLGAVLRGDAHVTLSGLEGRFLVLLRQAGLELPQTNRVASERRVDCRWPRRHLTVELDSYRYHGSRYAWERDRSRERDAYARGDELRRYTYGDVFENPQRMLAELRPLLTAAVS